MADDILKNIPLPADLPENWTSQQTVAPTGAEVGLDEQHGYNYLMRQVNNAQKALKALAAQREEDLARIKFWVSNDPTSPASFIGGTWERIEDRYIMGASDTYPAGSTGGEATHTLTVDEMPQHTHSLGYMYKYSDNNTGRPQLVDNGTVFVQYEEMFSENAGGNQPHNNMPPYFAVYIWKRVA